MLETQIEQMAAIIKNEDLKKYAGDAWEFIQAVFCKDPFAGAGSVYNVKDIIFNMPAVLFWDKMQRFLYATYHDYGDQVKLASFFNNDARKYVDFVKKQIYLIDEIDDDNKIDYYAALTRCLLVQQMEISLYFRLAKFLTQCTSYELEFIKRFGMETRMKRSAMISILYQYGLFEQTVDENTSETYYVLSSFGKALSCSCLNYEEGTVPTKYLEYNLLAPLNIQEAATNDEIDQIFRE